MTGSDVQVDQRDRAGRDQAQPERLGDPDGLAAQRDDVVAQVVERGATGVFVSTTERCSSAEKFAGVELGEHLRRARHELAGVQVDDVQLLLDAEGEVGAEVRSPPSASPAETFSDSVMKTAYVVVRCPLSGALPEDVPNM